MSDFDTKRDAAVREYLSQKPSLIFLENAKQFFAWNEELDTWIVMKEEVVREQLDEVTNTQYLAALQDGRPDVVREALRFKDNTTIVKMIRTIKEERKQVLSVLNGTPADIVRSENDVVAEPVVEQPLQMSSIDNSSGDDYHNSY